MKMQLRNLGPGTSTGRLIGLMLVVLAVVLSLPLWLAPLAGGPSVQSRSADGLLGVRRLLEEWGVTVQRVEVASVDDVTDLTRVAGGEAIEPGPEQQQDPEGQPEPEDQTESKEQPGPEELTMLKRTADAGTPNGAAGPHSPRSAMVVAFPAQRSLLGSSRALDRWVRDGGSLVVAYSGALLALEEIEFLAEFGAVVRPNLERGSLLPWRWWRQSRGGQRHVLVPDSEADTGPNSSRRVVVSDHVGAMAVVSAGCSPMVVAGVPGGGDKSRPGRETAAVEEPSVKVEATERERPLAAVVRCQLGEGVLWLLPTSTLVNARISNGGNLELLWRLRQDLGDRWAFLEGSQRLPMTPAAAGRARSARATLNMMAVQLGLLYLGSVLALAWRFGPRWSERRLSPEGHRGFLLGLGALHQNLGGLSSAAKLLHERWLDYDPLARRRQWKAPREADWEGGDMSAEEFVQWAQAYSRRSGDATR